MHFGMHPIETKCVFMLTPEVIKGEFIDLPSKQLIENREQGQRSQILIRLHSSI